MRCTVTGMLNSNLILSLVKTFTAEMWGESLSFDPLNSATFTVLPACSAALHPATYWLASCGQGEELWSSPCVCLYVCGREGGTRCRAVSVQGPCGKKNIPSLTGHWSSLDVRGLDCRISLFTLLSLAKHSPSTLVRCLQVTMELGSGLKVSAAMLILICALLWSHCWPEPTHHKAQSTVRQFKGGNT